MESLCAITRTVLSFVSLSMAFCTSFSLTASKAEVASSKRIIGESYTRLIITNSRVTVTVSSGLLKDMIEPLDRHQSLLLYSSFKSVYP